jgi:hypothetical protein
MTSIDKRTRFVGDTVPLDASWLFDELPAILEETGRLAARGVDVLALPTLGFDVDGTTAHFAVEHGALAVREGDADDGPIAILDAAAFSDLVQDLSSTFGLTLGGRMQMRRGAADDFVAWEPVLRAILDARPVYEPGSIEFRARDGSPLEIRQSFRIDESPDDIGHFLAEAGYLHLEGVFTGAEMAAVSADLSDAVAAAALDDGASWWARNNDGWFASRILGFNLKSPALRELLDDDRFRAIGTFTDDAMVQRSPHEGDSAEGLDKKPGVIEGISDVSWHKDCSLGGHSRRCCGMTVGISVTGADQESGELGVVPGSHRANVQQVNLRHDFDLERVALPTRTGDVTVHCSCTLHMSRPPVSRGRRVVYTGFGLAPRDGDVVEALSPDEIRRNRAALNDQTRNLQRRDDFGVDVETFELEATS